MAKSHLVLALVAAVILPTEAALKGIVLFAKGARLDGALTLVSKKLLAPIPLVRGE
ncbi:MAG: hypothetical protein II840_09905 [Kiritimatiellae bacterium]|nr:hypothetical protein [Kiritimatiellia bacterium]